MGHRGKSIPGRGTRQCPEAGVYPACPMEARVTSAEGAKKNKSKQVAEGQWQS